MIERYGTLSPKRIVFQALSFIAVPIGNFLRMGAPPGPFAAGLIRARQANSTSKLKPGEPDK
ncbi:hypothetical protein K8I61_07970 [bacterium]|nr:hypothetical protein [bacterium]